MKEVRSNSSNLLKSVYNIVREIYPKEAIRQEETIKIDNKTLFLDIYIPRFKVAIEVDGQQHYEFNKFYHADAAAFIRQKKNDKLKEEYCRESNISLVRIRYDEKVDKDILTNKIMEALRG